MIKPVMSTVACPEWTLERVAKVAEDCGYFGVELRTFGTGGSSFACEPFLTTPDKTRQMFASRGVEISCLATGARFDGKLSIISHALGHEDRNVGFVKSAVELAARIDCPLVRVFGFEHDRSEPRSMALTRICDRLELALATARNTGVRLVLENGGAFGTAVALAEVLDRVDNPLLGFAYSPAIGALEGESMAHAANVLGERLLSVKLRDMKDGLPCVLGEGTLHVRESVEALMSAGFTGQIVVEHDHAWVKPELGRDRAFDAEATLRASARTLFGWLGGTIGPRGERLGGGVAALSR